MEMRNAGKNFPYQTQVVKILVKDIEDYFSDNELKKRVDGFEVVRMNFDQAKKTYIAKR